MRRAALIAILVCLAAARAASAAPGDVVLADAGAPGVLALDPLRGVRAPLALGAPFTAPTGVAVDPDGGLLVTDPAGPVVRLGPDGGRVRLGTRPPFTGPRAIAVDANRDVYVADAAGLVLLDAASGESRLLARLGDLTGVAVAADGRLLVTDRRGLLRVDPYTGASQRVAALERAAAVAAAPDGAAYVAVDSGRILRVDPASGARRVVAAGSALAGARGIALAGDQLLVTVPGAVIRASATTGAIGVAAAGLRDPRGLAVLPNRPPRAAFEIAPNPAPRGAAVTFDATASTDPDGAVAGYAWDLDGDGTFETATGARPTASAVYPADAQIEVGLRVVDPHGGSDEARRLLLVGDYGAAEAEALLAEDRSAAGLPPVLSRVRVTPRRVGHGRVVRLRFRLSAPAVAQVTLRRRTASRYRRVHRRAVVIRAARGTTTIRVRAPARAGRYRLLVRARDPGGRRAAPRGARLRVVAR